MGLSYIDRRVDSGDKYSSPLQNLNVIVEVVGNTFNAVMVRALVTSSNVLALH